MNKDAKLRNAALSYYSRKDVQYYIYNFCINREIAPSFMMKSFGKRPDSLEYPQDVFELVKKGATSIHCSEELWENPLNVKTDLSRGNLNKLRIGWDLLIDIDSKYFDYSKIYAKIIIDFLKYHGLKNIGLKFSGSRGFHILVPWGSFPKKVFEINTKDMFPEYPKTIIKYILEKTQDLLIKELSSLTKPNKYIRDFQVSKEVLPDLVAVSSRHLFRAPFSLHEKTALCSVVISPEEIMDFDPKEANPLKVKLKNFYPSSKKEEAKELLIQALDWNKERSVEKTSSKKVFEGDFEMPTIHNSHFPPCMKKILNNEQKGRKRALFALINFFRSIKITRSEIEKRIINWNEKNNPPLKEGYVNSQISWSFKRKPLMPPNCKEFYQGIEVCFPDDLCKTIKNPLNYAIKKSKFEERKISASNKSLRKFKNKE